MLPCCDCSVHMAMETTVWVMPFCSRISAHVIGSHKGFTCAADLSSVCDRRCGIIALWAHGRMAACICAGQALSSST